MQETLKNRIYGSWDEKNLPRELDVLGKYLAARVAFIQQAEIQGINVIDAEKSNVYEDMCIQRIGGFAHGFDHELKAGDSLFHARLETFYYNDYSTHGNLEIMVVGEDCLVKLVKEAWNNGKPTIDEIINPIIGIYFENKVYCYNHCKE